MPPPAPDFDPNPIPSARMMQPVSAPQDAMRHLTAALDALCAMKGRGLAPTVRDVATARAIIGQYFNIPLTAPVSAPLDAMRHLSAALDALCAMKGRGLAPTIRDVAAARAIIGQYFNIPLTAPATAGSAGTEG